jgi:hypothetical protein
MLQFVEFKSKPLDLPIFDKMKSLFTVSLLLLGVLSSCLNGQAEETQVYYNDFEQDSRLNGKSEGLGFIDFAFQSSYQTFLFDNSQVLGRFGWAAILLKLNDLPTHDYIKLEFDLYVHDSWEGDGLRGNGEDVFILNFDEVNLYFSSIVNTKCLTKECAATQSFPNTIKTVSNPENAMVSDASLPGVCYFDGEIGGSKKIHFSELRLHSAPKMEIKFGTDLKEAGEDLCFKSWSIDNIVVSTIKIPDLSS